MPGKAPDDPSIHGGDGIAGLPKQLDQPASPDQVRQYPRFVRGLYQTAADVEKPKEGANRPDVPGPR
jgi:hypothetical protein